SSPGGRPLAPPRWPKNTLYVGSAINHNPYCLPAMRILILEDDTKIADFVSNGLKQAGYAVDVMDDGEVGLQFGLNNAYDAAVIDIMLPGCDGLSVIEQWRKARITTSVSILSAKHSVDDRVRGLQAGGDDYLTKPFAFSALLSRL